MSIINDFKNKYKGQTAYIIGSGNSIKHLKKEHFNNGIIIALNKTIEIIREIAPDIPVFSQQKDGNLNGKRECPYPDCYNCPFMRNPSPYTLLVHEHESKMCFEDYKDRIVFDNIELGLKPTDFQL